MYIYTQYFYPSHRNPNPGKIANTYNDSDSDPKQINSLIKCDLIYCDNYNGNRQGLWSTSSCLHA